MISFICCLPMIAVVEREAMIEEDPEEVRPRASLSQRRQRDPQQLLASLAMYLTYPLASGAVAFAVFRSLRGQRVSFFESFGAGLKRILPLFGVFICSILFVAMGFLPVIFFVTLGLGTIPWFFLVLGAFALMIPGLVLVMMVYVALPVCIVEKKGVFASMRRSRELTVGCRWQLFVAILGVGLLGYVYAIVVGFGLAFAVEGLGADPRSPTTLSAVMLGLMTVFLALTATASAVAYYHLRSVKDSVEVEDVANVFD